MKQEFSLGGRLLILDDDPAVSATIGAIAKSVDFETRAAADANDFFRILDEWAPTHIALDLIMPDVDGIEAMRRLGEMQCKAGIIITSGVGNRILDAARRAASEYGLSVAGIVPKPFQANALRALLTVAPAVKKIVAGSNRVAPPSAPAIVTEKEIIIALERNEFCVFYQPKIACSTNAVAGFEALVRWNRPGVGFVAPDHFIPLAEQTGLIDPLTDQIMDQGLSWLASSFPDAELLLSLNLSARSLGDLELANDIAGICQDRSIDPTRVILEITETSAMTDPVATLDILTRLRLKGFHLSIDDFGVGYSSLIQLARLPFSELKIDKMFIISAPESQESRNIVRAIVGLARSLGLRVTAEGVEDAWTLEFLREIGCDLAQGYFIGRPMAGDAVLEWIQS